MSAATALRALARVEWRQFRHHPRRTLLLALMVAVPVAAMTGGATLMRIVEPTAEETRTAAMGAATLRVDLAEGQDEARLRALLPAAARVSRVGNGIETVAVPGTRLYARRLALEPGALAADGLARGLVRIQSGWAPVDSTEVALSPVLLAGLHRALGDSVSLADGAPRRITGVVFDPESLDEPLMVRTPRADDPGTGAQLFVGLAAPEIAGAVKALRAAGAAAHARSESGGRGATATALIFLFGSVGYFEATLVIAAACAVSLRRRQREIGLLGSLGATTGDITRAMLVSAVGFGALASAFGVALGAAGAAAIHPWQDQLNRRWNGGFEVPFEYALAAAALGTLAVALATLFPARHAARLPIREALGARRPVRAVSRAWLFVGLATELIAASLLLVPRNLGPISGFALMGGAIFGVLGFGACSPWLLAALATQAGPLPLAWRLALRDSGRFAARNGPVVTAVLAAMAMGVMVAVLVATIDHKMTSLPAPCRDDQLVFDGAGAEAVARRVAAAERTRAIVPMAAAQYDGRAVRVRFAGDSTAVPRATWIAVDTPGLLRAIDAEAGTPAVREGALLAIGVPPGARDMRLVSGRDGRERVAPRVVRIPMTQNVGSPAFVMSREALAELGFEPGPPPRRTLVPWVVRLDRPVSDAALRAAQSAAAAAPGTTVDATRLHRGPARAFFFVMLLVCVLTGLVVVLVATALTAAESADDEHVLHTVGASPGVLRTLAAARAGYLSLLGCVLAVPAGLLPALGLVLSANLAMNLVIPWRDVALVVGVLPALAFAASWAAAGRPAGAGVQVPGAARR